MIFLLLASIIIIITATITLISAQTTETCSISVSKVSSSNVFPLNIINDVIKKHNDARRAVLATSMPLVVWNDDLSLNVLNYLKTCPSFTNYHSDQNQWRRDKFGFSYIGENLGYGDGTGTAEDFLMFVDMWVEERTDWTYEAAPCQKNEACGKCVAGKLCGHYTQVVWEPSTHVGCAFYTGCADSAYRIGCHYGVGGNLWNEAPYTQATCKPSCSATVPAATATLAQTCTGCTTAGSSCSGTPSGAPSGTSPAPGAAIGADGKSGGPAGSGGGAAAGNSTTGSGGGLSGGAVTGIVIGVLIFVALVAVAGFFLWRKHTSSVSRVSDDTENDGGASRHTLQQKFENADPELEAELLGAANHRAGKNIL